ncbi:MAG: hypothetical protein ISR91_03100, partial [Candidatus Delongbacteria bacterium]|nr:hypothetical protein [Candidatus Delongbacteria bacterium]
PSAYILPGDLQLLADVSPEYVAGIPTWDGTMIREGAILPEAEHQESIAHGQAGTIILQFGHALGLPNLYNSATGMTAIGKWGLMDQGSANFRGLIPAQPSAWTRIYKGWGEALELVVDSDSLRIRSVGTATVDPEIYRIPVTGQEYYLVENRIRDRNGDGITWGVDSAGDTIYFHEDYTLTFSGDTTGVIIEVEDLDYDIPGSGLLIWHVDESRITQQSIADNSLNDDPDRRGVDLEEGDGVQDIGHSYSSFHPRGGAVTGNFYDAWSDSNAAFLYVNPQLPAVEFSHSSIPDTRTNDGWESNARFFDFSRSDTVMTFSYSNSGRLPGYPVSCSAPLLPETATLLTDGGVDLLLALTGGGWLAGFNSELEPLISDPGGGVQGALPSSANQDLVAFGVFQSRLATLNGVTLQEWQLDSFAGDYSVVAGQEHNLLSSGYSNLLGLADGWLLWGETQVITILESLQTDWLFDHPILGAGLVADTPWLLVAEEGLLILQQGDWVTAYSYFPMDDAPLPVSAVFNTEVDTNPWIMLADGAYLVGLTATGMERWRQPLPGLRELAVGDLDQNGVLELIAVTQTGINLYNPEGVLLGRRDLPGGRVRLFPAPYGGNGLYACDEVSIHGWSYTGGWAPLSGFPRTLPEPDTDLLYSAAGRYYLCDTQGLSGFTAATGPGPFWSQRGGRAAHDFCLPEPSPYHPPVSEQLVEGQVYSWPNPSRHNEPIHLVFTTAATAAIEINIFDRTGRLVTSRNKQVGAWSGGEMLWDVTAVSSGIYYAHIEARFSNGGSSSEILKLAVIK